MERVQVVPDEFGIVAVRHNLGTREVQVRCFAADGSVVGYLFHGAISAYETEVATVPGSGVVAVEVQPTDHPQ